jgi:PAS domain S-box-containing protein
MNETTCLADRRSKGVFACARRKSDHRAPDIGNIEALKQMERKYRSMFDEAFAGLFELGPDGHILHVNPAMTELLGYGRPEQVYADMTEPLWTRAVSPERSAELTARMKAAGYVRSFEMEILRNDGSRIWISTSARAKWQNGALIGYTGVFEDITERKQLREQLLQAQKLESVGQVAAGIAHEINTPVQYIGDNVRFLQDSFGDLVALNAGYARLLAGVRSTEVTPQMLEEVSLIVAKVDVDYLFEEIPKAIEQTLEGVSRVSALVGAMKEFSHPGTGEKVPLDLNHTKEIGKGTGQGLAIARSVVVDKDQGTIDFETVDKRGTTFIIRLPCEAVPSSPPGRAVA